MGYGYYFGRKIRLNFRLNKYNPEHVADGEDEGEALYQDGGELDDALGLELLGNWLQDAPILKVPDGARKSLFSTRMCRYLRMASMDFAGRR